MSDDEASPHQRFVIDIGDRQTILVAHNVDLARRVPLGMGDRVMLRGLYQWNDLGGLVHWTHDNPLDEEDGGWVKYRRKYYR